MYDQKLSMFTNEVTKVISLTYQLFAYFIYKKTNNKTFFPTTGKAHCTAYSGLIVKRAIPVHSLFPFLFYMVFDFRNKEFNSCKYDFLHAFAIAIFQKN